MESNGQKYASGMVIKGVGNASYAAETLVKNTFYNWRPGNCGIAIANKSGTRLTTSGSYSHWGRINAHPLVIENDQTGLVTGEKRFISPYGTEGLLTYEIGNTNTHLQIAWIVPFYTSMFPILINIAIGPDRASRDLFLKMQQGAHGTLVNASLTVYNFRWPSYNAHSYVKNCAPTSLAILFGKNSDEMDNKNKSNDHDEHLY